MLRRAMGLKQEPFAKKIGISRTYLSQIETGREPSPTLRDTILKLEKEWRAAENSDSIGVSEAESAPIESERAESSMVRETPPSYGGARAKLKAARLAKFPNLKDFCKATGYTELIYRQIEDGSSNMSRKMAEKVAKVLDLDVSDLLDGSDHPPANGLHHGTVGETPELKMPPGQKARFVPLLSMAQCGRMMAYDDSAYDHSGFIALNPKDGKAFALTLAGDSMIPDIRPGDTALVYPSFPPKNGGVVIARLNDDHGGDVMLKLYQQSGNNVTLSSYNPAFPPMTFQRSDFLWIYPVAAVTRIL